MKASYMKEALALAEKGKRSVDLNPMVGSVIVKDGLVIGKGYHERFGCAHAERNAINHATKPLEGSTMYVTLEPCSHHGKTPPCADYIIEHKLKKVIVASLDPNPLVAGRGIKKLQDAGIEVEIGLLDEENRALNKVFYKYMTKKMPYVTLKTAMSLDGKIATHTHDSKWITNPSSRMIVHEMREEHKAIMVGINTVLKDDPLLNTRTQNPKFHPIRIIVDSTLKIPLESRIVQSASTYETIILSSINQDETKQKALEKLGVKVLTITSSNKLIDLKKALKKLAEIGINSILLEGGGTLNEAMLKSGLVDEVVAFIAPKIIGGKDALTPVEGKGIDKLSDALTLTLMNTKVIEGDLMVTYRVEEVK
ncbi:MAG: bifunctional diaminohydroxyphosphoribosylaminopyrimidine deaminase/5-amino-6-(5-phosphoribosylamino)uracil reductase RibD [Candidatus Izemoplasmataceae bacterium]